MNTPRTERIYETTFIIPPTVGESQIEGVVDEVKASLTSRGAEIQVDERWGRRRLAYPIDRHDEGTYVMLQVKGSGDAVQEAERRMRLSESVIRYLSVRVDNVPGALEASDKRRARKVKQDEERAAREAARAEEAKAKEAREASEAAAKAASTEAEAEAEPEAGAPSAASSAPSASETTNADDRPAADTSEEE